MRDPSVHIKESDLITVLQEVFPKTPSWGIKKLAKEILNKSKSYSTVSRGVRVSNDKIEKKVVKMKLAGRSNTAVFAQMLLLVRRQMKHRGISLIKVGDKDWLNLKESCKLASEFCNEFELDLQSGYKHYITIGLKKMKNFSIYKFKTLHSAICNEFEAIQIIESDKTPSKTEECHNIYLAKISEKTGYSQGYKDFPEKYQYFVKVKEEAKKHHVSNQVYLDAQFKGFEWANSVPDPAQLVGLKSIDRLQKYAFENNIRLGEKSNNIDWTKIKDKNNVRNNRKK